jgi:hypothetical protein
VVHIMDVAALQFSNYQDKLWVIGGWYNSDHDWYANTIYTSENGENWTQFAGNAPTARYLINNRRIIPHSVVFNDAIWDFNPNGVYRTTDGINWTQMNSTFFSGIPVVMNNKLYVVNGGKTVWSTTDGITWTELTTTAPYSSRDQQAVIPYNNGQQIMLFGGWSGYVIQNDVWVTSDGENWTQTTTSNYPGALSPSAVYYLDGVWSLSGLFAGALEAVSSGTCTPDWECSTWGACNPNDLQTCLAMTDQNNCGQTYEGTYEIRSCVETCVPNWQCNDYPTCVKPATSVNCTTPIDSNSCNVSYDNSLIKTCVYSGGGGSWPEETKQTPTIIITPPQEEEEPLGFLVGFWILFQKIFSGEFFKDIAGNTQTYWLEILITTTGLGLLIFAGMSNKNKRKKKRKKR